MGNMINPEYRVVNSSQFLPEREGIYDNEENDTSIKVIKNPDGSNGVSLYEGDKLVAKTVGNDKIIFDYDKENKLVKITAQGGADVEGSAGILVLPSGTDGKSIISHDVEWLKKFVFENSKLRGENGVLIENDPTDELGKVVKLDDEYIIRQGEF